jgi:hypothetical protein
MPGWLAPTLFAPNNAILQPSTSTRLNMLQQQHRRSNSSNTDAAAETPAGRAAADAARSCRNLCGCICAAQHSLPVCLGVPGDQLLLQFVDWCTAQSTPARRLVRQSRTCASGLWRML